jgi:hypothetical protein
MNVVGRRRGSHGGLAAADGFLKLISALRAGRPFMLKRAVEVNRRERKEHKDKGMWLIFLGFRLTRRVDSLIVCLG